MEQIETKHMCENDSSFDSSPTSAIWEGLLAGDPGPTVALFDALMDADFAFAAGGFLRDIAERFGDIDELVESDEERSRFKETARAAISCCLQDDFEAVEELLREGQQAP